MADWIDYYEVLGVGPSATPEDIDRAYRRKAQEVHPDHNKSSDATEQMKLLNQARICLKHPDQRLQFDKQWTFRNTPPLPVVDPPTITFSDVTPGEVQNGSFVISNKGGIYDGLTVRADDGWITILSMESMADEEELPARVSFTAVVQDWDRHLANTIRVKIDETETVVRVSLHSKARPVYASYAPSTVAAAPTPPPAYAPSSPPYSPPIYAASTVAIPKRKWASRRFAIIGGLVFAVAVILAVGGAAIAVLQNVRPWERPVWSLSLPGAIRAIPLDANADQVLDEVAAISWWTRGAESDSIKLTVMDKQGNVKSTRKILSRLNEYGEHFPRSFDVLELYPIDYDSDGVINELFLYVANAEFLIEYAFSTVLMVFNADGEILWQWTCHTYVPNGWTAVPAPTCNKDEAAEKHHRMLTEYAYPVYDKVQNYPRTDNGWKHIVRIIDGMVESYPGSANLAYPAQEKRTGSNRNLVINPSPTPTKEQTLLRAAAAAHAAYGKSPATSPNGRKVARFEGDRIEIIDQEMPTGTKYFESKPSNSESWLSWSPDGQKLAHNTVRGGSGIEVRDVITTSRVSRFVCQKVRGVPSWSPDSKKLMFTAELCYSPQAPRIVKRGILVGNTEEVFGTQSMAVVEQIIKEPLLPESIHWSPDGKRIAFLEKVYPYYDTNTRVTTYAGDTIFVIDLEGREVGKFKLSRLALDAVMWTSDSNWLIAKVRATDKWYLASPDGSEQKGPVSVGIGTTP